MSTDQTPALARATERMKVSMLGTTDGDLIDADVDVPAGEMFRLAAEALPGALSAALEVDEMAALIWETSRRDEGTISATGAKHVAQALRAHLLGDE